MTCGRHWANQWSILKPSISAFDPVVVINDGSMSMQSCARQFYPAGVVLEVTIRWAYGAKVGRSNCRRRG